MKGQNCKGIQTPEYNGPKLIAVLRVPSGKVTVEGRLNNPRKNEQAVLTEICAKVKAQHPKAKLVSFKRKEGRA